MKLIHMYLYINKINIFQLLIASHQVDPSPTTEARDNTYWDGPDLYTFHFGPGLFHGSGFTSKTKPVASLHLDSFTFPMSEWFYTYHVTIYKSTKISIHPSIIEKVICLSFWLHKTSICFSKYIPMTFHIHMVIITVKCSIFASPNFHVFASKNMRINICIF